MFQYILLFILLISIEFIQIIAYCNVCEKAERELTRKSFILINSIFYALLCIIPILITICLNMLFKF